MIFHGEDPSDYVREMVEKTNNGEFDEQLVYQKRLRRKLHEYQKNVPPQVRAARLADEINAKLASISDSCCTSEWRIILSSWRPRSRQWVVIVSHVCRRSVGSVTKYRFAPCWGVSWPCTLTIVALPVHATGICVCDQGGSAIVISRSILLALDIL